VIHDHLQIVPIVRHVLMVIDQNAVMIAVQVPIDQQVVHTETATHVHHRVQALIDQPVVHTETETHVQALIVQQVVHMATATHVQVHVRHQIVPIVRHVLMVTDQSVVMIVVRRVIDQPVAHTETEIPVRHRVHRLIGENVVTAHVIHDHLQIVPIVRHVLMAIAQNVVMIVVRQVIAQLVVHTETEIHDRHQTVVQVPIVHVAKIHMVAIAHAQAMIAMPVRLRVTANAEAVQIVPEVVSPMIAKSVHAVALAKSA
jgi:hypothetical protein